MELDRARAKNWITVVTVPQLSHEHQKERIKSEDHVDENSGKRKRTTRVDIMESSPNESTEQKQQAVRVATR